MDNLLKTFTFLVSIFQIFNQYPLWFKGLAVLWAVFGILLLSFFIAKYPEYKKPTEGNPKFITDRISRNELAFTIVNPENSKKIRIVDLKLLKLSESQFVSGGEDRFDLSKIDLSKEEKEPSRINLNMDLSTSNSIFYDDKVINIDKDDAASFRVKFYANEHFSNCKFRLIAVYVDTKGNKKELFSDNLYVASKWSGITEIESLEGIAPRVLVDEIKKGNYAWLSFFKYFYVTDFSEYNMFSLFIDLYNSRKVEGEEKFRLIEAIGHFTVDDKKRDLIFEIIGGLDNCKDFGSKYHFIEFLIEKGDRRVIPVAQSFIASTKNLKEVSDPINVEGSLEMLQEKLKRLE